MTNPQYRRKPTNKRLIKVRVERHHMYWIRGMLMARYRRNVTFKEIAEMTGMSQRAMLHILTQDRISGATAVARLLTLRNHGIMIHPSDFQVKSDSNPADAQTSRP